MADPLQWLREQVAETRRAAEAAAKAGAHADAPDGIDTWVLNEESNPYSSDVYYLGTNAPVAMGSYGAGIEKNAARLIVMHDPRAVLAQFVAHERIITRHAPRVAVEGRCVDELICGCSNGEDEWHATPWPCDDVRDIMSAYQHRPGYAQAVADLTATAERGTDE